MNENFPVRADRAYDVVVWGATGFTGRLVAAAADGLPERAILLAWGFESLLVVAALWLLAREPGPGRARAWIMRHRVSGSCR